MSETFGGSAFAGAPVSIRLAKRLFPSFRMNGPPKREDDCGVAEEDGDCVEMSRGERLRALALGLPPSSVEEYIEDERTVVIELVALNE